MPYIHIKSLPFEQPKQISEILCHINRDFSVRLDIPLEHVHSTWEYFNSGHFAKGDVAPKCQPDSFHSLLVELLTPAGSDSHTSALMLEVLATSIALYAKVPIRKIFIHHLQVASEMVFDDGEIANW